MHQIVIPWQGYFIIFISFFFKKPKQKKSVKVAAGTKNGDDSDDEEEIAVIEEADVEEDEAENDEGQRVHNEKVAKTLQEKAMFQMADNGITIDSVEERVALQNFPKVASLAHCVHDNAVLKEKFESDMTKIFSVAETPLVVDVLPTLETLCEGLIAARDDEENNPANVVWVACHAAVLLVDKYLAFSGACDIYTVAMVVCPDHKLKWFQDHGHDLQQIKSIKSMICDYWENVYASEEDDLSEEENKVIG
ncbi:hypothetical protein K443DRAFT_126363 [Laccaria amethystina LaAM-08-1]|uniref:Uncharacterized protein n=1 Tax=Laccaria amethystina LaAM-08-1 TaxID=1095629 RepID=A0A0C9X354_9AGAR|nr:hypothetical protein K443DRAFT_126363 [Laccaria amethystina LaAM-08-1]